MTQTRKQYYGSIGVKICTFLGVSAIALMITLMALTFNVPVEQKEYAVGYNTYEQKFTRVYEQGKYVTEVGEEFHYVGRTQQSFHDEFQCLTKDKILIDLVISTHFVYLEDDLIPVMFKQYGGKEELTIMVHNKVIASVKESCLLFDVIDYYDNRALISSTMYDEIDKKINDASDVGVHIDFIRLTNINFPTSLNNIIIEKQNVDQTITTELNNRASVLTQAQTEYEEALRTADINIINANNTAQIILNQANTDAQIQEKLWLDRATGYSHAMTSLDLNTSQVITYIDGDNVKNSKALITN